MGDGTVTQPSDLTAGGQLIPPKGENIMEPTEPKMEPTEPKMELNADFFKKLEEMLTRLKDFHLTEKGQATPETLDKVGAGSGMAKDAATSVAGRNKEIEKIASELEK
jgi:hypothetical protein